MTVPWLAPGYRPPRDLPATAPPAPPLSDAERRQARRALMLGDHGFLRHLYNNQRPVSPGVWRAAQPAPAHLERFRDEGGRTVLNLRGRRETCGVYRLEREACARLGLVLIDFPMRSRGFPEPLSLIMAESLFPALERPLLIHCKSGADRAGLMAALYLHVHLGRPLADAQRQLSLRYGHVRQGPTGRLDYFLERYGAEAARLGLDFGTWVRTVYDPHALARDYHQSRHDTRLGRLVVDRLLRRE